MSIVVPVNNENISDAAKIHSISWQESHRSFCSDNFINEHSVDHQQEYINSKMKHGSRFFMLCDEIPVAVVSVTRNLIEDLYVLPDYQNRGYGSMLLEYAVAMVRQQSLIPTLWILENNFGAKRLYERKGFVPSGITNTITGKLSELEYVLVK